MGNTVCKLFTGVAGLMFTSTESKEVMQLFKPEFFKNVVENT